MDFVTSQLNTFTFSHFWAWLLNTIAITSKSEDKYVVKVFNWLEVLLSKMTCYKIHTLIPLIFCKNVSVWQWMTAFTTLGNPIDCPWPPEVHFVSKSCLALSSWPLFDKRDLLVEMPTLTTQSHRVARPHLFFQK